jgi:hypothetical protein
MTWILPKQLHTLASALDTEALSLDCTEQSEVCAQSLFVRSKPLPSRTWSAKWKRDSWTRHLSGRILEPSLGERFATEWTSSLEASLASPSVQQGSETETKTLATSSPSSSPGFRQPDLPWSSSKTWTESSAPSSPDQSGETPPGLPFCSMSSESWSEWVTAQRQEYSARLNAERLTKGSGCSSWPTSSARDWKGCYTTLQRKDGKMRGDLLPDAVNIEEMHGPHVPASSSTDGSRRESWATPIMGDSHLASTPEAAQKRIEEGKVTLSRQNPGKLNPRWVETLMGLPVGWTMPSCVSPVTIERTNCDC